MLFLGGKKEQKREKEGGVVVYKFQTFEMVQLKLEYNHNTLLYSVFHFQVFKISPPKPACGEFRFWPSEANKCTQL